MTRGEMAFSEGGGGGGENGPGVLELKGADAQPEPYSWRMRAADGKEALGKQLWLILVDIHPYRQLWSSGKVRTGEPNYVACGSGDGFEGFGLGRRPHEPTSFQVGHAQWLMEERICAKRTKDGFFLPVCQSAQWTEGDGKNEPPICRPNYMVTCLWGKPDTPVNEMQWGRWQCDGAQGEYVLGWMRAWLKREQLGEAPDYLKIHKIEGFRPDRPIKMGPESKARNLSPKTFLPDLHTVVGMDKVDREWVENIVETEASDMRERSIETLRQFFRSVTIKGRSEKQPPPQQNFEAPYEPGPDAGKIPF